MLKRLTKPIDDMPRWEYGLRLLWIGVQLILAFFLSSEASRFFYQAF